MRRILVLLSVVALMAVMMIVTVAPAFADGGYGKDLNYGHWCGQDCGWHGTGNYGTHGAYDNGYHGVDDGGTHGAFNRGVGNIP
jgi:hypothetical protein